VRIPEASRFARPNGHPASVCPPPPPVEDTGWIPAGSRFAMATGFNEEVIHGLGRVPTRPPGGFGSLRFTSSVPTVSKQQDRECGVQAQSV
jgi:hypothetical protein